MIQKINIAIYPNVPKQPKKVVISFPLANPAPIKVPTIVKATFNTDKILTEFFVFKVGFINKTIILY